MAFSCEHLNNLRASAFPMAKTPAACEECLKEERFGWRCASVKPAAMSAAATRQPASTRPDISIRRNIRSCARGRRRRGHGATSTGRKASSKRIPTASAKLQVRILDRTYVSSRHLPASRRDVGALGA